MGNYGTMMNMSVKLSCRLYFLEEFQAYTYSRRIDCVFWGDSLRLNMASTMLEPRLGGVRDILSLFRASLTRSISNSILTSLA